VGSALCRESDVGWFGDQEEPSASVDAWAKRACHDCRLSLRGLRLPWYSRFHQAGLQ
jgi:hypothetical protein